MNDKDLADKLGIESGSITIIAAALQDSCNENLAVEVRKIRNTIDFVTVELRQREIGGKE